MDLIEVPEKVYSVAQFDLCWCGAVSTGWLVAGRHAHGEQGLCI